MPGTEYEPKHSFGTSTLNDKNPLQFRYAPIVGQQKKAVSNVDLPLRIAMLPSQSNLSQRHLALLEKAFKRGADA
jgi:hypothetical protein